MVEEAFAHLDAEHVAHAGIQHGHGDGAFPDQLAQGQHELLGRLEVGAHVETGENHLADGVFVGGGHVVLVEKIFDGVAIADHVTLETHARAQNVREEIMASGDGDTVVIVVRAHDAQRPTFYEGGAPWHHEHHLDLAGRLVRIGPDEAVAAALRHAIDAVMLGCSSHAFRLYGLDLLAPQPRGQERVFAVALDNPAPARIARQVEDRRVDVRETQRFGLFPGDMTDAGDQLAVPRAGDAHLGRETSGPPATCAADPFVREVYRDA